VGKSDEAKDLNYVYWSFFPAKGNHLLSEPYYDNENNWTITFDLNKNQLRARTATFTVQVASMRIANGNAKWTPVKGGINDLPWTVNVNGAYEST
jgi:rhamnogalacturonan endolyase